MFSLVTRTPSFKLYYQYLLTYLLTYLFIYLLLSSSLFFCNINVNNNIILIVIVISAKEVRFCLCLFVYTNRITRYVLYQIRCVYCGNIWMGDMFSGVNLASHS